VDLLSDPAVAAGVAALQAAPDPGTALREAVAASRDDTASVGARVGALFTRLAALAADRCEAVAKAEEEQGMKKEQGRAGIVALP